MNKPALIAALLFASVASAQDQFVDANTMIVRAPIAGPFRNFFHRFQQRFHRQPSPQPQPSPEPMPSPIPDVSPSPVPDTTPSPNVQPAPQPPTTGIIFYIVVPSLTTQTAEQAAIERSDAVRVAVGTNGFKWLDTATAPKGVLAAAQAVGLPAMLAVDFSLPADKRLVGSAKLTDEKSLIDFLRGNAKTPAMPMPPVPEPK